MSVQRNSAGTVLVSRTYMMDGLGNVVGSALDGSTGAAIIYDSWGNVQTDSTAMMRLNTLRFGYKGMLYDETTGLYNARARWYDPEVGRFISEDPIGLAGGMNQYVFAGTDPINASDPSGAMATDAQGAVCSINATSCGDALQMPGGIGYGGLLFDFANGSTNGDVTYAQGPLYHGLLIVDQNLRTAFDAFIAANPSVGGYLTGLQQSSSLFVILDVVSHPWAQWAAIGSGWSYGGPDAFNISQQSIVDKLTAPLGLTGALGLSLIQSDEAAADHFDLGKVVAHEALHLSGLLQIGRKYTHSDGPFTTLGCMILSCKP